MKGSEGVVTLASWKARSGAGAEERKFMGSRNNWLQGAVLAGMMLLAILLAMPAKAYGYTDPGTGTFAYQAVYAAFIGGSFYIRKFLKRFFGKRSGK
jgi:hypothetical protein